MDSEVTKRAVFEALKELKELSLPVCVSCGDVLQQGCKCTCCPKGCRCVNCAKDTGHDTDSD